jgi:hypothetical protein
MVAEVPETADELIEIGDAVKGMGGVSGAV